MKLFCLICRQSITYFLKQYFLKFWYHILYAFKASFNLNFHCHILQKKYFFFIMRNFYDCISFNYYVRLQAIPFVFIYLQLCDLVDSYVVYVV